jgi:glycosyltransferase involved in cell wall biosynthesis
MKILHVEAGMNLYGGAQQVLYLMQGLRDAGVHNALACPENSVIAAASASVVNKLYAIPLRGDLDFPFACRLRSIIRREQPDVLHLHSRRGADILGGLAACGTGVKTVVSRRNDNPENRTLVKLKYRLFDKVVAISDGIRQVLLAEGLSPEKVVCVRSAIDPRPYQLECNKSWFYETFDLQASNKILGVVAQFIPRKGHRYLLAAMPSILRRHPETRLLLFGKGVGEKRVRSQVARLGLEHAVRIAGFREDLQRVFPCLDILVHPAAMEGLGVALLQAASAGVPLVGTSVGGIPEIVRHGENGLLVPPHDPESLSAAICHLLDRPDLRHAMARKGTEIVDAYFSVEAMVAGNLNTYRSLLAARPPNCRS